MSIKYKSQLTEYRKKHYTGLYSSWYAMKQRCGNSNNLSYKNYGGRGISYPESWKSFEGFKRDIGDTYKKGLTLERNDTNKNYSIDNCRWATRQEQAENKRCNIVVEYAGQKRTLLEWWKYLEMDISYNTLRSRFYRGMSPEDILEETGLYRPARLLTRQS